MYRLKNFWFVLGATGIVIWWLHELVKAVAERMR